MKPGAKNNGPYGACEELEYVEISRVESGSLNTEHYYLYLKSTQNNLSHNVNWS